MKDKVGKLKGNVLFFNMDDSIVSILKKEFLKSDITVFETDELSVGKKLLKKEDLDVVMADYHDPPQDESTELLQYMPDRFNKIIKYQKKNPDIGFYRAEVELGFEGTTHAEIGAYFLDMWNFPEVSIYTALFHHTPEETFDSYRELMDIFSFVNEFAK